MVKGIILAGGNGSRLYPITKAVCKQLLPVYNKPMIYYPLSVLMLAGIREILIIVKPEDENAFKNLLGDGNQWGINIQYALQHNPGGLAEAFIIGEDFIGNDRCVLILGDNILYQSGLQEILINAINAKNEATIFTYLVADPKRYGVVELDDNDNVLSIEEKPEKPKSRWASIGLYIYNNDVIGHAKSIKPSSRGEREITDINKIYLARKTLKVQKIGRGAAWLDMGTYDSLLEAAQFVQIIEKRQGTKIADLDEISKNMFF